MNCLASIQDFFKSPKWKMNLLLGGVTFRWLHRAGFFPE